MAKDRRRRRSPRDKPRSPSAEPAIRDDQPTPPPSKQRPESPHLWWAQIRIGESVLDGILFLWAEPDDERGLPRLWRELIVAQRKTKAILKSVDWGSVPPDELVMLAAAREAVRAGIEKFLPPAYADLPASSRKSLFCHVLIVIGIGGVAAGRMDHPLDLALTALGLDQAGQHAVTEMARRGKGQIGFYEALVVLGQQVGCPEDKAEHALTVIRKAAWRHLPSRIRTEIGGTVGVGTSEDERAFAFRAVTDALNWKAREVGQKRWGDLPWQELLVEGLRRKLNIAPKAIADRLKELYRPTTANEEGLTKRPKTPYRSTEPETEDGRPMRSRLAEDNVDEPAAGSAGPDPLPDGEELFGTNEDSRAELHRPKDPEAKGTEPIIIRLDEQKADEPAVDLPAPDPFPDAGELLRQLLRRLVEHSDGDRLVRALAVALSPDRQKKLAREWRVTPQTLINWKNELRRFIEDGQR